MDGRTVARSAHASSTSAAKLSDRAAASSTVPAASAPSTVSAPHTRTHKDTHICTHIHAPTQTARIYMRDVRHMHIPTTLAHSSGVSSGSSRRRTVGMMAHCRRACVSQDKAGCRAGPSLWVALRERTDVRGTRTLIPRGDASAQSAPRYRPGASGCGRCPATSSSEARSGNGVPPQTARSSASWPPPPLARSGLYA
jgi:hypothetical protein